MNTYDSLLWGPISEPESIDELFISVLRLKDETKGVRFWRGHADIDWRLDSSLYRRVLLGKQLLTMEKMLRFKEQSLLERARHRGYDLGGNGRELPDMELLARLQHHGAATRLIDFTRNAMIGLFFACESLQDRRGALLGLHTNYLGGYEGERETGTYEQVMNSAEQSGNPITWEPMSVSPRITAQHSQFCYSTVVTGDRRGSLLLPKEEDGLVVISITPTIKVDALVVLSSALDIRFVTLFPDLDGFCHSNGYVVSPAEDYRW